MISPPGRLALVRGRGGRGNHPNILIFNFGSLICMWRIGLRLRGGMDQQFLCWRRFIRNQLTPRGPWAVLHSWPRTKDFTVDLSWEARRATEGRLGWGHWGRGGGGGLGWRAVESSEAAQPVHKVWPRDKFRPLKDSRNLLPRGWSSGRYLCDSYSRVQPVQINRYQVLTAVWQAE